jgi:nucleotide-binding universal stress UspA family protein
MKRVGVLIDFSMVSEVALKHASVLPDEWIDTLYLIHIAEPGQRTAAYQKLQDFAADRISPKQRIKIHVDEGEFFETVPNSMRELNLDLVVVGTHGIRGISDPKYGLNIVRLIDAADIPFLIVQDHSSIPRKGYDQLLLPVLADQNVQTQATFISDFTQANKARLSLLNIQDEEDTKHQQFYAHMLHPIKNSLEYDFEKRSELKGGLAKSILQYASIEDVKIIAMMREKQQRIIPEDDFVQILLNRFGFAALVLS